MSITRPFIVCSLALLTAVPPPAWSDCFNPAGAKASNANDRYIISDTQQEVFDKVTKITWQRCPWNMGITPDGKNCIPGPGSQTTWQQNEGWQNTNNYGPTEWMNAGWIIPTRGELATLIDRVCTHPAINQAVFPNTPPISFWTRDGWGHNGKGHHFMYVVDFAGHGNVTDHEDNNPFPIRLRYVGQLPSNLSPSYFGMSPAIVETVKKQAVGMQ